MPYKFREIEKRLCKLVIKLFGKKVPMFSFLTVRAPFPLQTIPEKRFLPALSGRLSNCSK